MLNIKNNSNLLLKSFQNFLLNKNSEDFLNQIGIWILGYVTRRLRASEDEASMVFLKFWLERGKLLDYFNTKGCKNIFGFLSFFSKNLLNYIRKKQESLRSKEEFVLSQEIEKHIERGLSSSNFQEVILRYTLKKLPMINRVIICLRYGISLSIKEKDFLLNFLNSEEKYQQLLTEFEKRLQKLKSKDFEKIEKLNLYQWKLLYSADGNLEILSQRKKRLQKEILKAYEIFSFGELSTYLGLSKYKVSQSCEYSLQFLVQDLYLRQKEKTYFQNEIFQKWKKR